MASPTNSHSPQQNESALHSMHNNHHHSMHHSSSNHHMTNGHDHQEYTDGVGKSSSPINGHHHHHHHHKSSINHQDVMMSSTSPQHVDESTSPVVNGQSVTKYSLLQFAMQHFRNEWVEFTVILLENIYDACFFGIDLNFSFGEIIFQK